jgi:hypothetical protein
MAMVWNPQTGRMEDDGVAMVRPMTGSPIDTAPDDVTGSDLIVGGTGAERFPLASLPPSTPADEAAKQRFPLRGDDPNATGAGGESWGVGSPGPVPSEDPGSPEDQAAAAVASSQPVTVPTKAKGGGGGGGTAGPGAGPTVGQVMAHGAQLTANEAERDVIVAKGGVEKEKADALVEQDRQEALREKALQDEQKKIQDGLTAQLKEKQDVLAKDKIHDMFEGKPLSAVLAALGAGLGAFAATRSGGVNHAQAVLDRSADMFRQKELHRFEQEEKAVGGAERSRERAEVRADVQTAALYRKFAQEREAVLRRFGAKDAQVTQDSLLQQNLAKAAEIDSGWQNKVADISRQAANDKATRAAQYAAAGAANANAEQTRAETAALKAGGGKPLTHVEREKAEGFEQGANQMKAAADLIENNPAAWKEYQKAAKEQKQADELAKTKLAGDAVGLARYMGQSAFALEQRLTSPAAKEIHASLAPVAAAKARQLDPVGALNEGALRAGWDHLGILTRNPAAIVKEIRTFEQDRRNSAKASLGASSYAAPSARQPGAKATGSGLPPLTPIQRAKTAEWLRANPNDPRAERARARLME